jgi:hypothetical protein
MTSRETRELASSDTSKNAILLAGRTLPEQWQSAEQEVIMLLLLGRSSATIFND